MTLHSERTFLNTSSKLPKDHCKDFSTMANKKSNKDFRRLSVTSKTTKSLAKCCQCVSDIRCLVKLYESIPDYCELHHLNKKDFYNTLESYKTSSKELKSKVSHSKQACVQDRISISSSNLSPEWFTTNKWKTKKKKRKSIMAKKLKILPTIQQIHETPSNESCAIIDDDDDDKVQVTDAKMKKTNGLKLEIEKEVNEFKKSLKDFETEFKHNESPFKKSTIQQKVDKNKLLQENLLPTKLSPLNWRKSFSYNDLNIIATSRSTQTTDSSHKGDVIDNSTASKYNEIDPQTMKTTIKRINKSKTTSANKKSLNQNIFQQPFKVNDVKTLTNQNLLKDTPSPIYPVSRPNLAAILRLEHGKKKIKEWRSNFNHSEITASPFDWEVRKTPSWKALSLNEKHQNILAERLAIRKAEQALQRREYDLNMEIMRQRVKSAPLLLEGSTYWVSSVAKLKHNCQKHDNIRQCHLCPSNNSSSKKSLCHNSLQQSPETDETHLENLLNSIQLSENRKTERIKNMQKIYGTNKNEKFHLTKRNHQRNPLKSQHKQKKVYNKETKVAGTTIGENDSADDLTSLDKAYL